MSVQLLHYNNVIICHKIILPKDYECYIQLF